MKSDERPADSRPAHAAVDLSALRANLRGVRARVGRHPRIMAVVKANAYGHGMLPLVKSVLDHGSAQYFGVAIPEEGRLLRAFFPSVPVHVFTAPLKEQAPLFAEHGLEATACDFAVVKALNAAGARAGRAVAVHVKVDTGMGRIGVTPEETHAFVRAVQALPWIELKGIWTHFATSDEKDLTFARRQLSEFRSVVTSLELAGVHVPLVHCANSGAIMQMPESYFDMVRPGIMMYGYAPSHETRATVPLRPVMSVKATVGFVKRVAKGTSISYGRRYIAKRATTIASVTFGYADGYFRRLTGSARVLIRGRSYPVAGTVCMDQIMVDVGNDAVRTGDEVVLIGRSGRRTITGWDVADAAGTIPYEVTCAVSQRVPRRYIHG